MKSSFCHFGGLHWLHWRPGAGTYVRIRGLVAWAALMQSVALSGLLAAKDSVTPLKAGQKRGVNRWVFLLLQLCEGGTSGSFFSTWKDCVCVCSSLIIFLDIQVQEMQDYGYDDVDIRCLGWPWIDHSCSMLQQDFHAAFGLSREFSGNPGPSWEIPKSKSNISCSF